MATSEANGALALSGTALPPEQAQFQKLLAKIDQAHAKLDALNAGLNGFQAAYAKRVSPLLGEVESGKMAVLNALDARLSQPGVTAKLRSDISEFICETAVEMQAGPLGDRATELVLHHRHGIKGFDKAAGLKDRPTPEEQSELPDRASMEQFLREALERMQTEGEAQAAAHETAREAADAARRARQARKKPSAKQLEAEQEAQDGVALMRGIYRKLVSALHPDRETDVAAHAEKTALLVQVNDAYKRKDLLALLHLQGKAFGQAVEMGAFAASAEGKLRHFNKLLTVQLNDLTAQYRVAHGDFCHQFNTGWGSPFTPEKLERIVRREVKHFTDEIGYWATVLVIARDDRELKEWLKQELQMLREDVFDW